MDRVGEKISSSHILRRLAFDDQDFALGVDSLGLFLSKHFVYNSVNTFDSLCAHHNKGGRIFQGVFRDVPESSLPAFLGFLFSSSVGFSEPFINENNLYVVRVFGFFGSRKTNP